MTNKISLLLLKNDFNQPPFLKTLYVGYMMILSFHIKLTKTLKNIFYILIDSLTASIS